MAQVGKDKELTGLVSWKEETSSGGGNSAAEAGATTSVARVCLAASVVDSFHGNEEEDKGCDLVFVALARHQAKRGTRDDAPSSSLAPLVHLLINCAARPPYPREEIIEELV
ncbi:hypothetical protein LWI28_016274 [Acer negundo]|uniref:Uncharacterized protein n=1 Tax=Acer negundo TaxID=4023 RepID=A0AAD5JT57_ACENE|nr:hypothetical protein LWI28_016274 [Acer negundo]